MFFNFFASFIIGQFFNTMLCKMQVTTPSDTPMPLQTCIKCLDAAMVCFV